jgi:epoxyqueuosine reductase
VTAGVSTDVKGRLRQMAREQGFPLVRFAAAAPLLEARAAAQERRAQGHFADMGWMIEEWIDRATDPGRFLAGARAVMMVALPCGETPAPEPRDGAVRGRIARYARGRDYHRVFEKKLRKIAAQIRDELGGQARATVDYGPLLERPLAARSGMGWLGKSTMLLVPGMGPWVLLGAIATDLAVGPDEPLRKSCGTCRRCIVACPTGAIAAEGGVVDARRCISYHTIENRGPIPRELRASFGAWIFGCDECLSSCPVGGGSAPSHPDFLPRTSEDERPELVPLLALDETQFRERYQGRPMMRAKRDGLLRNACVAIGNIGSGTEVPALLESLVDRSALVRGHAAWALGRLRERGVLDNVVWERAAEALRTRLRAEPEAWVREEFQMALETGGGVENARETTATSGRWQ